MRGYYYDQTGEAPRSPPAPISAGRRRRWSGAAAVLLFLLTMALLGGLLFVLIGAINEYIPWRIPLWRQGVIGALIVTWAELVAGLVLNVWLRLGIWDYSNLPGNFMGQICPQFTAAWVLLSVVAVVLDDWLRYWLFGEDRPHYKIWRCT